MAELAWIGDGEMQADVLLRLQQQMVDDIGAETMIVISVDGNGDLGVASTTRDKPYVLYLMEHIKLDIIRGDYG